jgi:four helix bundle protein
MQDYHQLDIWNRAMDYAVAVYEFVASLPEQEKYNLASQLRRAVTSVPLNIAEGCGAASNTEFGRFLGFAYRSLKEAVTALELCERLYPSLPRHQMRALIDAGNQISKMTLCFDAKSRPGKPVAVSVFDSQLRTQHSKRQGLAPRRICNQPGYQGRQPLAS